MTWTIDLNPKKDDDVQTVMLINQNGDVLFSLFGVNFEKPLPVRVGLLPPAASA